MTERSKHEERYFQFLEKDGTKDTDSERQSLFYILASWGIYDKIDRLYDFNSHEINLDGFEESGFSSGHRKMVLLAFNLFNNYPAPTPLEIFSSLDKENFKICMNAIKLRFNQPFA